MFKFCEFNDISHIFGGFLNKNVFIETKINLEVIDFFLQASPKHMEAHVVFGTDLMSDA